MSINRFPRTDFNKINLDWIMRNLKEVKNVTDNIGTAVEDAQQAAAEATTAAAGAVAAAADATQAAEDAVAALSGMQDDVAAAVQTANSAQSTATGASNTAATALSRANSAQTAAGAAQTTADGALAQADLAREETAAINSGLVARSGYIDLNRMTTSSGSVATASQLRLSYNDHILSLSMYVRINNSTGRPTLTISGLPSNVPEFTEIGAPTYAREGSTTYVTDSCIVHHPANTDRIEVTFFNHIGSFPAGSGYLVASADFTICY